jgi:hypothetical protein
MIMEQSYILDVKPRNLERTIRLYTNPISEHEKDDLFLELRNLFESGVKSSISGLHSLPVGAFFSGFPPSDKLRGSFAPSPEEFSEPYDAQKITNLEQALYIHLVGNSIAMPVHTFTVVGQEAVNSLLAERSTFPDDLSRLLNPAYFVLTDYSKGRLVVGLHAK